MKPGLKNPRFVGQAGLEPAPTSDLSSRMGAHSSHYATLPACVSFHAVISDFRVSPSSQSMMSCKSRDFTADKAIQPRCSRSFVELVPVAFSGDVHGTEQFAQPFNLPFLIIGNVLICQSVLNQFFVAHGHQFFFCFHCCPFL